ncbi:ABC transporter substrate-binding protein [Ancylobacter lacus]|nr:ABC transporter substrate-binding protein [Ancylobacter lacus]MBS7538205.1 ABC transporter substrate-binding protein [Ancylobacter lacus]
MRNTVLGMASLIVAAGVAATPAQADVGIGLVGGITGGTAALAPEMMKSYQFAVKQVNDQGGIKNGEKLIGVVADDGCNAQTGVDAVTKVVNVSQVVGMAGPWCSGVVLAVANSVTIPAGVVLITPAGTSPQITALKDNDLVFRTVPSDEYQGQVLARTLLARGTTKVALSFINNDYGKGLADAFQKEFVAKGGTVAARAAHEENRASYRTDLAQLAKGGADTLVLIDYGDSSGLTVLRESIENDFFKTYVGGEGMKTTATIKTIGSKNLANFYVSSPVSEKSQSLEVFASGFKSAGGDPNATFVSTSYDAVFLLALAIEQTGGDKTKISAALRNLVDAAGESIMPGEWAKAKALIAAGKPISYKGASGTLAFDANGDVPGAYALFKVNGDDFQFVTDMK